MSEEKKVTDQPKQDNHDHHEAQTSLPEDEVDQIDSAPQEPIEEQTVSADEFNQLKDQYLRLAADMENLRRRTTRDIQEAKTYAVTGFARDLLSVADNLQRALDATQTSEDTQEHHLKTVIEGIEMTQREMLSVLDRHGITKINPQGQKFDPHFHQAIFEVENADLPDNTIHEVVQEGFKIGDRILRPAMVGVSHNKNK